MAVTSKQIKMLSAIVQDEIKKKIVKFILEKNPEGRFHNEICARIGGSKTTVHSRLVELELSGFLHSKPGIHEGRLVRLYYIRKPELELIDLYRDLLD